MDITFMKNYEGENRKSIIDNHETDNGDNRTWTEDEIVDYRIKIDLVNSQYGDGYISLSLVYAVFALGNFVSVAIVKLCGNCEIILLNYNFDILNFWFKGLIIVSIYSRFDQKPSVSNFNYFSRIELKNFILKILK